MFALRIPYARRYNNIPRIKSYQDWLEKFLQFLFGVGTTLLPVIYIFSPSLNFANYNLPTWCNWIGSILLIAAVWFFYASHKDLGKNWSPSIELRGSHTLITTGIYSKIRHPMYLSAWLWNLAIPFLLHNWIVSGFALFAVGMLYFLRVFKEEQMMIEAFGEAYERYMKETGRVLPWF